MLILIWWMKGSVLTIKFCTMVLILRSISSYNINYCLSWFIVCYTTACRFAISSHQDSSSYQITLFINNQGQFQSSVVVATYESHGQCCSRVVNNSLCHISSLEVYRGREQAIEISHDGLSLTENGAINVRFNDCCITTIQICITYR